VTEHGHGHGHGHGHADAENPFAGQGSVLLDIGDDVGALVVAMPASTVGVEVEIRPVGGETDGHHPHVAVVSRPVGDQTVPSLVYGELTEGSYELYEKGGGPVRLTVAVQGGAVTEADWPSAG
jgi:hypothetical protein